MLDGVFHDPLNDEFNWEGVSSLMAIVVNFRGPCHERVE